MKCIVIKNLVLFFALPDFKLNFNHKKPIVPAIKEAIKIAIFE
jgi:hypothetical protein